MLLLGIDIYLYLLPPKADSIILASSLPLVNWLSVFVIYSQLGLGHTNHVREPTLVTVLQGKNVRQISAGRCHSAAWTAPPVPPRAPGERWNIRAPAASPVEAQPHCLLASFGLHPGIVLSPPGPHTQPERSLCYQHCKYFCSRWFSCRLHHRALPLCTPESLRQAKMYNFRAAISNFSYIKEVISHSFLRPAIKSKDSEVWDHLSDSSPQLTIWNMMFSVHWHSGKKRKKKKKERKKMLPFYSHM